VDAVAVASDDATAGAATRPRRYACTLCEQRFYRNDTLRMHIRTVHERTFAFLCHICEKQFSHNANLQKHLRTHPQHLHTLAALRPCLRRSHAATATRDDALCRARIEVARLLHPDCSVKGCAAAPAKRGKQQQAYAPDTFACIRCSKKVHWACAGLDCGCTDKGIAMCQPCLAAEQMAPSACLQAATNAALLADHLAIDLGKTIVRVPGDGLCLVRSVAAVLGHPGPALPHLELLRDALLRVPDLIANGSVVLGDAPATDDAIKQCAHLANTTDSNLVRLMTRNWDSALFDVVVKAISCSVGRPLHIYSMLRGEPVLNIIQASNQPPGQPLTLMHTHSEIGRDHYDAVI
jgi:hypothetical protein